MNPNKLQSRDLRETLHKNHKSPCVNFPQSPSATNNQQQVIISTK